MLFALVASATLIGVVRSETLVEHEYGVNHNQMDDGAEYAPAPEVSVDDPTFAQGYVLN